MIYDRKKILFLCALFCIGTLQAKVRSETTYLIKITNNARSTFKIFCSNRGNRPVVIADARELNTVIPPVISTAPPEKRAAKNRYEKLFEQKWDLIYKLRLKGLSEDAILQGMEQGSADIPAALHNKEALRQMLKQLNIVDIELQQLMDTLAPVVVGKTVLPDSTLMHELPCKLGSPEDEPDIDKPKNWTIPKTVITDGQIKITIIDTAQQKKCPKGTVTIEAENNKGFKASLCVRPFSTLGKVHLIINEDGTFELKDAQASLS